jgi:hypothetical protein
MANVIQQKFGTAAPASDALAKGELAIRFVAADHTASSSSKLYFGEGDSANLRQFGFGIAGDSGQHGIAIGENFTITGGNALTTAVSGDAVTINHDDTSSQASVNNSGQTFIQDITLDTYGHITAIASASASSSSYDGNIADLDIDGATDIGAAIVDADLFIIDDGAGGTNRKATMTRLKDYMYLTLRTDLAIAETDPVTFASVNIGADSDGSDRQIVFGHSTLKSTIGIDDSHDVFAINTDGNFEVGNDFEIDASGNVVMNHGNLTVPNGEVQTPNIGFSDGTNAMVIASDGVVTFPQRAVFSSGLELNDSDILVGGIAKMDRVAGVADSNTFIDFGPSDVLTFKTGGTTAATINSSQLFTASGGITSTAASNTFGTTSFNDANITNVGSIALDTITNDGTDITLDSSNDIVIDAAGGNIELKDGGVKKLTFDLDSDSDDVRFDLMEDDGEMVFRQYDGTEVLRIKDNASLAFVNQKATMTHASNTVTLDIPTSNDDFKITGDDGGSDIQGLLIDFSDAAKTYIGNDNSIYLAGDASTPEIRLITTSTSNNNDGVITFQKTGTGSDGEYIGEIQFLGDDDAGNNMQTGGILNKITDASNGTEDSVLEFETLSDGTLYTVSFKFTGTYDLVFPANDGSSDQVLSTDGSGNLSWSSISGLSGGGENNQDAFANIAVSGQSTVAADAASDTLNLAAGSNVTITTDAGNDTVTIAAADTNTTYSAGAGLDLSGTTFSIENSTASNIGGVIVAGTSNEIDVSYSSGTATVGLPNDVTVTGDLTVTGGDVTIGGDSDGTDRTITFGHSTLKTIMGIDDSQDIFAINTDASFQSQNDLEIDANGNVQMFNGYVQATELRGDSLELYANSGALTLSVAAGNIDFDDGGGENSGTTQLRWDLDSTAGQIDCQLKVDGDDLVFKQYDGNEVIRIADDRKLYFFDQGGESIHSDGSKLILTSGGTSFNLPTSDGSSGQVIKTDGSGNLSFVDQSGGGGSSAADDISTGDAAVTIGTSSGSVTLDAATDVILDAATGITHIRDAGDSDDELKITVTGGTGATTIETISAGADGHLTMKADGDLQISATSASEKSVISTSAGVLNENTQFIYVVTAGMSKVGTSSHERHLSFNTTSGNSTNSNGDLFNHYHLMPFPAKLVSIRGAFSSSVAGAASTFFRLRKAADNATSLSDVYKWNNTNVAGIHAPDAMTEQGVGGAGDSFEFLDAIRGSATVETGTSGIQTFNEGDKIFGGFSVPSSVGTDIRGCFTFVFVATTGYTAP